MGRPSSKYSRALLVDARESSILLNSSSSADSMSFKSPSLRGNRTSEFNKYNLKIVNFSRELPSQNNAFRDLNL